MYDSGFSQQLAGSSRATAIETGSTQGYTRSHRPFLQRAI